MSYATVNTGLTFQPTLPLRGATEMVPFGFHAFAFQPTLPLRGATKADRHIVPIGLVSTHAPLAGSDSGSYTASPLTILFQPTLPLRGATAR